MVPLVTHWGGGPLCPHTALRLWQPLSAVLSLRFQSKVQVPASLQMTPPGPFGRGAAGSWFIGFLPCRWRLCLFLPPPPPPNSLQSAACGYSFHLGDFGRGGSLGEGAPGSCRDLGAGHSETKQGSQFRPGLRTKAGEGCGAKNSCKCLRCPTDPHQLSQGSDGTGKAGLLPW